MGANIQGTSPAAEQEQADPEIELTIATDKMAAYIKVKPAFPGQDISPEFIAEFLKSHDITYGLREQEIRDFCIQKHYYKELLCARGLPVINQEQPSIAYKFKIVTDAKPKEREDGTVDFRDLGLVQNVAKGAELCCILMPPEGRDGIDIYDNVVPYKKATLPHFPAGKNTEVSEDGMVLRAAIDGCVEYRNNLVDVEDVYTVNGDVDTSSGNIEFTGAVVVRGDVREGFSIQAGGDVSISGMAEGAMVESGGNIAISNGMNGMLKGILRAKNDVTGKYFENATIECGGNLYADVLMNCKVKVEGAVILKGKKALLIGGHCEAGRMIYANTIGSSNHIHTNVTLASEELRRAISGIDSAESPEARELQHKLEEAVHNQEVVQEKLQLYTAKKVKTEKDRLMMKALLAKKAQASGLVHLLEKQVEEIKKTDEESRRSTADFKVIAISKIHPGVKLTIGPFTQYLEAEYSNTKIYADDENILFVPVTPADKMDLY